MSVPYRQVSSLPRRRRERVSMPYALGISTQTTAALPSANNSHGCNRVDPDEIDDRINRDDGLIVGYLSSKNGHQ